MAYITETQKIIMMMQNNRNTEVSEMLRDLIEEDKRSKYKAEMKDGVKYYKSEHDILQHDFRKSKVDGVVVTNDSLANDHLVHSFHRLLVDQKSSYIVGNPIKIATDEDATQQIINDILGTQFDDTAIELVANVSNKGVEYLHIYIDDKGEFQVLIVDAEEIIPVYDTQFQKKLEGVIRYYPLNVMQTKDSGKVVLYRVEIWSDTQVTYYVEQENGEFILEKPEDGSENPRGHFQLTNTVDNSTTQQGWSSVPFIEVKNNKLKQSDLKLIKTLIDNYDYNVSDYSNLLKDVQEAFIKLFGADNTNLAEFMKNLKKYKSVKVPQGADIQESEVTIPTEARENHLKRLEENIFIFGLGVNLNTDKFGNAPSGIALKFMYSGLDLKANALIRELNISLQRLIWFVSEFAKIKGLAEFNPKDVSFTFDKQMIFNEYEKAQICQLSKDIISDETIAENHPFVSDTELEKERMTTQQENTVDLMQTKIDYQSNNFETAQ